MTLHTSKAHSRPSTASKSPVVIFAPCLPSKSGIATYVDELMPYHLAEFDVTLVVADDAVLPDGSGSEPRILLASEFRKHRSHFLSAPKIYHVGNNPDHCHMLDFMGRDPGIVVLHDFNLNFMHETATLGWQVQQGYVPALAREYGALGSDGVRERFERKNRGLFATYELPMNGDILESATGVIAHSRYVQYKVAARVPRIPVWYIPHFLSPAIAEFGVLTRSEARKQLRLPENELVIASLGFITYAKRIPMFLAALADLRARVAPFRIVFVGEKRPAEYDVDADIAAFGLKQLTTCTGFVDEPRFFQHLAACDIVSNLRHPSGGETSGTLIRALGMGVPTIVLDHGPMGELPDSIVRKVAWDQKTHLALTQALYELMTDTSARTALGRRAAVYTRDVHGIEAIARRYSDVIRSNRESGQQECAGPMVQHFPNPKSVAQHVRNAGSEVAARIRAADGKLWWCSATIPLAGEGQRALVVSPNPSATADLVADLFAWPRSRISSMTPEDFIAPELREPDGGSIRADSFVFALVIVRSSFPENCAAALLRRLNAALLYGGSLTLEIWSEDDEDLHNAPLAEPMLSQRLTDAGFAIMRQVSPRDGLHSDLVAPGYAETRGTCRFACVTARKISTFAVWQFMDNVPGVPMRLGGRVA